MVLIILGYVFGIINKLIYSMDFVIYFYVFNLLLVAFDLVLYFYYSSRAKSASCMNNRVSK
ncbi:MAG: hypothetical protein ACTTKO_00005 [Candidatus Limimorpha sp.]